MSSVEMHSELSGSTFGFVASAQWGRAINTFIFQSMPDRFDLRHSITVGKRDTWYATRYRDEMAPGDIALLWMGGDADIRGLYGWARLVSTPYKKKGWDKHGVDIEYGARFSPPVLAGVLELDPVLWGLPVVAAPQGTNFLLQMISASAHGDPTLKVNNSGWSIPPSIITSAASTTLLQLPTNPAPLDQRYVRIMGVLSVEFEDQRLSQQGSMQ